MRVYNFGGSVRNLTKFYQRMWPIAGVIKWILILQRVPPTKLKRVKNFENLARFLTTVDFDHKYLWNGSTHRKSEKYLINFVLCPIRWKKFGELRSTNNKVIDAHVDPPKWTFFGILNFGPHGVLAPEIFTRARHWPRLASAHRKSGQGSPEKY